MIKVPPPSKSQSIIMIPTLCPDRDDKKCLRWEKIIYMLTIVPPVAFIVIIMLAMFNVI